MKKEREVIKKHCNELTDAPVFFEKHAGFRPEEAPAKYGDGVEAARKAISENLEVVILFNCENIKEVGDDKVTLESGYTYVGDMPPRILKDSVRVINYIITLSGFDKLKNSMTDMMAQYFMDAWGTAFVEAAQDWFGDYVKLEVSKEGMKRTHLWSPGQHNFGLSNQRTLFGILTPEDAGCSLTRTLMMVPVKSVSGIIGITSPDVKKHLLPCDFCKLAATCPASKRGCAEL